MSDTAIKVENLSKRYRIGLAEEMHDTFAGALTDFVTRPIKNLRRLRRLTAFEDGRGPDDRRPTTDDTPSSTVHRPSSAADGIRSTSDGDIIWALRDVCFEVQRGEVVGIIGRNGAGKTTLLKILSRITEPTGGRVEINGRVSSLLEVGTGFHAELTGRENIYLNGAILGMTKAEIDRKFDEIVDFSGVEKFIDTPVKRYSSGMRVRLAFSVAAHLEPEILLVDEVLAVGDAIFQRKCLGKMEDVAREGRTVLFVSHNMTVIQHLCMTGILLEEGRVVHNGAMEQCVRQYLESGAERKGSIVSHAQYNDSGITLEKVAVNGSQDDRLHLPPNCHSLDVEVCGRIERPMRLLIEARIYDMREHCLAFFTPRQAKSHFELIPSGRFRLKESIGLPRINQGTYFLSLYIADSDIHTKNPAHIHRAVHLEAKGTPTIAGRPFKYEPNGWVLLSDSQQGRLPTGTAPG